MAKQDEKLQAYEELTTQMNASTVALDAEKRQKLYKILHQKPEFAQLLEKFKALCSDDETRKAISDVCPASEADDHFDFKAMLQSMGAYCKIDPDKDGYVFNWPGKQTAIQLANEPTENTLIPDKADSRDWDTTQNIYIEGDNLEALKCLRNAYAGKVKMIYIDPPYNTGNDFIYSDNFHGEKVSSDDAGKHTKWLNMMYPRLMLARELLSDDGVIFISIDDNEIANLKEICDSVFGRQNYRNMIITRRRTKSLNNQFADQGLKSLNVGYEQVIVYAKSDLYLMKAIRMKKDNCSEKGRWDVFWSNANRPTMRYEILGFTPSSGQWRNSQEKAQQAITNYKKYISDYANKMTLEEYSEVTGITDFIRRIPDGYGKNGGVQHWIAPSNTMLRTSNWLDIEVSQISKEINLPFDNPKNKLLMMELIKLVQFSDNDLVFDFFSGSATTAHAVMQLNAEDGGHRKFIMMQLPEPTKTDGEAYKAGYKNICDIGKARIRKAGDKIKADNPLTTKDLDIGFRVFRVGKSNIPKWWRYDGTEKNIEMFDAPQNKRTDEDKYRAIAYEFMLKHKCMLDARVDEYLTPEQMAKTGGKPLFVVDGALFICPVGGVNAAWATSVVALRRSRYAMTSNDAWFVAVNDTLDDSSDNRDSDKLLAVKTLVEAGLPAKHFLHI